MKKITIYVTTLLIIFLFKSCGIIKEFKSLNPDELFRVSGSTYGMVQDPNTKVIYPTIIVNLLNDSIVKNYNINHKSCELEVIYKNVNYKFTKDSTHNDSYLKYYLKLNNDEKYTFSTYRDKFEVTLKVEVNGFVRTMKYISE